MNGAPVHTLRCRPDQTRFANVSLNSLIWDIVEMMWKKQLSSSTVVVVLLSIGVVTAANGAPSFHAHYLSLGVQDTSTALATDASGNVFIGSTVTDVSTNRFRITKTDGQGNVLTSFDFGFGDFGTIASATIDPQSNIIVAGTGHTTTSTEGFLIKFDNRLTRVLAATTLPGVIVGAMVADRNGNVYVGGSGGSAALITPGAFETKPPPTSNFGGPHYAFIAKLSPDLEQVLFGTYFGGNQTNCYGGSACIGVYGSTSITSAALDSAGNVLVAGSTNANDLPVTTGAYSTQCGCSRTGLQSAVSAGFIAKFSPDGSKLISSTFLPLKQASASFSTVQIISVVLDKADNIVVAGSANQGFPISSGALQSNFPGSQYGNPGGFLAKLDPAAAHLVFATYFGGGNSPSAATVSSIAIDSANNIWLTGRADALGLTTSDPVLGSNYIASLSADGSALSTLITAPRDAAGVQITVEPGGAVAVLGNHGSFLLSDAAGIPSIVGIASAAGTAVSSVGAPIEIFSLYGYDIGPSVALTAQVAGGIVASSLTGYQVLFNGVPAPLLYVGANQINCMIPSELRSNSAAIQIVTPQGAFQGPTVFLTSIQPELFQAGGYALAVNQDGSINSADHAVPPGSVVSIWGTGLASADTTGRPDGAIIAPEQVVPTAAPVSINFFAPNTGQKGILQVDYAGDAPDQVWGLSQLNVQMPGVIAPGSTSITITAQVGSAVSDAVSIYAHP
ncbi:MAG TPA: hypothetical protein VKV15_27815 [Bryobacteraceae bacterium]|nr:hypothetical protein [Bryobacteraceae bacterium]